MVSVPQDMVSMIYSKGCQYDKENEYSYPWSGRKYELYRFVPGVKVSFIFIVTTGRDSLQEMNLNHRELPMKRKLKMTQGR